MKKVQLYINETKDEKIFKMIERFETESENKRGYVSEKIKENLKAFELISEHVGSNDPMEVLLKVVSSLSGNTVVIKEKIDSHQPLVKESTSKLNLFVDAADENFGMK